jgi:hypothetical protein
VVFFKVVRSRRGFKGDYLDLGRECFLGANINNQSKFLGGK